MLLLLRSAAGPVSANAGINFGVNGIAGPTAAAGIAFNVPAPTSIELNVFAGAKINFLTGGIPVGYLAGAGATGFNFDVTGFGGFGFVARADITFGVAGTVGTTLQGIGNASTNLDATGAAAAKTTAGVSLFLNLTGSATISGGTLTPSGTTAMSLTVNGSAVLNTPAIADFHLVVQGTGFPDVVGLATDMRLTFECDSIRTFFRKG